MNDVGVAPTLPDGVPTTSSPSSASLSISRTTTTKTTSNNNNNNNNHLPVNNDAPRRDSPAPDPRVITSSPTLNGDAGHKTPEVLSLNYDEAASPKADSEAETIIQSGREELSPQKRQTVVKHKVDAADAKADSDARGHSYPRSGPRSRSHSRANSHSSSRANSNSDSDADGEDNDGDPGRHNDGDHNNNNNNTSSPTAPSDDWKARKRKRSGSDALNHHDDESGVEPNSRPPSKSPTRRMFPQPQLKLEKTEDSRLASVAPAPASSSQSLPEDGRRLLKRTDTGTDKNGGSDEGATVAAAVEGESRRRRDQHRRPSGSHKNGSEDPNNNNNSNSHNNNNISSSYLPRASKDRSASPVGRSHRRATSSSLNPSVRPHKKRRPPPPLITERPRHCSEDRESTSSSSVSGSPMPNLKPGKLASGDHSIASPAKHMKKKRDQNGRTRLARACAAQELEAAKKYHIERPDDLDVPDNAGNTPLQIASLEGCAKIVKYLLDAGCDINTRNIDKDTPLIDAVENGHLDVVKLLLDAGVNPRAGNAEGDQPYDLVPSDCENYDEMRRVIKEAKARHTAQRKSEDFSGSKDQSSATHDVFAASPRDSTPAVSARSPPPMMMTTGRRKTVRSEATRNDLLWTSPTPENLREFAAKGDMAGVVQILNVLQKADTESLIAAAKGGHDEVMGILLGMGDPDPNPEPINSGNYKPGYNTPMLAAIGRGNTQVIRLLLDQAGFDPTRLDRGRTFYEISRERKGENWEEESRLLKNAFDNHSKSRKDGKASTSTRSPRRSRDKNQNHESRSKLREETGSPEPPLRKRSLKSSSSTLSKEGKTMKEKRRREEMDQPSRGKSNHTSSRKESSNNNNNHHSNARLPEPDASRSPRRQSQAAAIEGKSHNQNTSSTQGGSEETVRRRRLIAGRPPPDRPARRESLMSSDSHSGRDEHPRSRPDEPNNEQQPKMKRATSPLKRRRSSASPVRSRSRQIQEEETGDQHSKRRKVQTEEPVSKSSSTTGNLKPEEPRPLRRNSHSRTTDNRLPRDERSKSRRASTGNDKESSSNNIKVDDDRPPLAKEERPQSDSVSIRDVVMHDVAEEEAKKEKATREAKAAEEKAAAERKAAEEKRLAAEAAERERQERERQERAAREAKEAAERAAAKAAQEEERKRKEEQKRVEQELARQAKLRREQEEQEQRRREALPNRLCSSAMLIGSGNPRAKSHEWLKRFLPLMTVTTKSINPSCDPESEEEMWIPNFLVAPLLATNDLQLSQSDGVADASWEKRTATPTQRVNLWRVTMNILTENDVLNPITARPEDAWARNKATRVKFYAMEHIFWVKLSDFMDLVPHIAHLHGLQIKTAKMHIDPEPSENASPPNHETQVASSGAGSEPPTNGYYPMSPIQVNGVSTPNERRPSV